MSRRTNNNNNNRRRRSGRSASGNSGQPKINYNEDDGDKEFKEMLRQYDEDDEDDKNKWNSNSISKSSGNKSINDENGYDATKENNNPTIGGVNRVSTSPTNTTKTSCDAKKTEQHKRKAADLFVDEEKKSRVSGDSVTSSSKHTDIEEGDGMHYEEEEDDDAKEGATKGEVEGKQKSENTAVNANAGGAGTGAGALSEKIDCLNNVNLSETYVDDVDDTNNEFKTLYCAAHARIILKTIDSRKQHQVVFSGPNANDTEAVNAAISRTKIIALLPIHPKFRKWYDQLTQQSAEARAKGK